MHAQRTHIHRTEIVITMSRTPQAGSTKMLRVSFLEIIVVHLIKKDHKATGNYVRDHRFPVVLSFSELFCCICNKQFKAKRPSVNISNAPVALQK